ncbi:MAG: hypothetical protein U1A78_31525 [Polyangia bacterium]
MRRDLSNEAAPRAALCCGSRRAGRTGTGAGMAAQLVASYYAAADMGEAEAAFNMPLNLNLNLNLGPPRPQAGGCLRYCRS